MSGYEVKTSAVSAVEQSEQALTKAFASFMMHEVRLSQPPLYDATHSSMRQITPPVSEDPPVLANSMYPLAHVAQVIRAVLFTPSGRVVYPTGQELHTGDATPGANFPDSQATHGKCDGCPSWE